MGRGKKRRKKKALPVFVLMLALLLSAFVIYRMMTVEHIYFSPYTGLSYNTPSSVKAVGVDVSQHQGTIDWQAVQGDGITFALIRAAYRGTTAGTLVVDTRLQTNIEEAQAAGIKVGVYIYSQAITEAEAEEEAAFVISLVSAYDLDLPIVIDYEFDESHSGRLATAALSAEEMTSIVSAFCAYVADQGYTPMVYGNAHMLENNLAVNEIGENEAIWYANYNDTTLTESCALWQYTESGTVAGISGNVDCDFSFVALDRLGGS